MESKDLINKTTSNKKRLFACLLTAFMTASIYGCANTPAPEAESPAENVSAEEPSATQDSSQPAQEDNQDAAQEASVDSVNSDYYMNKPFDNPEAGRAPAIPGNGRHFVKYDGRIYFRIPKKAAMREAALWGDYDYVMADDSSTIACMDIATNEITELFDDSSFGPITISGGRLILAGSKGGKETAVQSVSFDGSDRYDLPGTSVYGTLPSGEYFVTGGYGSDHKLHLYICDAAGESKEIQNSSEIYYFAGISDDYVFCVTRAADSDYGRFSGYDIRTGEEIIYGDLPEISEYAQYAPEPEYLTVKDGTVMVQMSVYEGSGHFFTDCMHFSAKCDEPGSLKESIPVGTPVLLDEDSIKSPVVYAPRSGDAKRFVYAEGDPGTCDVIDGYLGYFDDTGSFVKVTEGYGYVLFDNYEDRSVTEICELVDGDIYVVKNDEEYAPEACIGWRDAYRRYETRIDKVSVIKKDVFTMAHLISDPLDDLVAKDILEEFRADTPMKSSTKVSDEAKSFGLWVQENIGKENFPEDIREMGTNIGNRYEFCFGTDISNSFDNDFPYFYEVYYSLKDYYTSEGNHSADYYEDLMDANESLGNGNPENIEKLYSDLKEIITACNNIIRQDG